MSGEDAGPRNLIALDDLGIEQLTGLQKQFEREIEFFSESIKQLRLAAGKFGGSEGAIENLAKSRAGETAMIPLSESMYIRAILSDPTKALIDIGTGYYVEMPHDKAAEYFQRKQKYINSQVEKVDALLRERNMSKAKVTEKVQQKIRTALSQQQSPQ